MRNSFRIARSAMFLSPFHTLMFLCRFLLTLRVFLVFRERGRHFPAMRLRALLVLLLHCLFFGFFWVGIVFFRSAHANCWRCLRSDGPRRFCYILGICFRMCFPGLHSDIPDVFWYGRFPLSVRRWIGCSVDMYISSSVLSSLFLVWLVLGCFLIIDHYFG